MRLFVIALLAFFGGGALINLFQGDFLVTLLFGVFGILALGYDYGRQIELEEAHRRLGITR